nr:MAG TPA: hypothetical protein [Caudoviricetes sp.]
MGLNGVSNSRKSSLFHGCFQHFIQHLDNMRSHMI